MPLTNPITQKLRAGEKLFGGWFMSASPVVAEAMSNAGYDFVMIDLEHGPLGIHGLLPLLQAVDAGNAMPMVRMPSQDPIAIKHALDQGAMNVVFPYVQDVAQTKAIVNASLYPPQGERGYAKMHRGSRYTTTADYVERINDEVALYIQIETPLALQSFREMAKVPGVTGLLFGPGDLAMAMGLKGDVTHPDVRAHMETVGRWCKTEGVLLGTVLPTPELVAWAFEVGYNYVALGSDLGTLMGGMRSGIGAVHKLIGR